jgi:glycerol kinase
MAPVESRPGNSAIGLDLGSTSFKAGHLDSGGRLGPILARPAPPLTGDREIREGDPAAYAATAGELLGELIAGAPGVAALAIAAQRSSFVLWERESGRPLTPLISWQDRRAADWCRRHAAFEPELFRRTGLVLSGHYAGPKLAALQQADPELAAKIHRDELRFGTLESWLIWLWSGGRVHQTDPTMAARTAMLDVASGDWSEVLLAGFNVPRRMLPEVRPTTGRSVELDSGLTLTASIADQAAGALAVFGDRTDCALINVGTGAFVLRPTKDPRHRLPGYLTGLIFGAERGRRRYALEGAINGAGVAIDSCGTGPTELPDGDPSPDAFCVPDSSGLGAPYWRAEMSLTFNANARILRLADRRRVVLEGLVFRIREILEDLTAGALPKRIFLAGGLAREPFLGRGLAAVLDRPVEILEIHEAVLTGAARLGAALAPFADPRSRRVDPAASGAYLHEKYRRWRGWFSALLGNPDFG